MRIRKSQSSAPCDAGPGIRVGAGRATLPPLAALLLMAACSVMEIKPVDIFPEDMCIRCKMAISDQRSAGEVILADGTALKFDDLRCMASHVRSLTDQSVVVAWFVSDFGGGGWIDAREALFVRSARITTPMSSGTVAFRDRAAAEAAAAKHEGEMLRFSEVFGK